MRGLPSLLALSMVLTGSFPPAMAAERPDAGAIALDDIGTRLQFAYYTADVPALRRELASLVAVEVSGDLESLKATYLGYAEWKQAELQRQSNAEMAALAARNCVAHLEKAVAREPLRAVLPAMLSVCQRLVSDLEGRVRAPLAATRSRQNLERAQKLAPRDPRVLLIAGINEHEQRLATKDSLEPARERLLAATAAFENRSPAGAPNDLFANALDWGQAEAWAALGRVHLKLGDAVAARDAFERALVLVEDYKEVRDLLQGITGQRPVR